MGEHREVFVAFDVAKLKHAVAIAEGDRSGEVRFLGEIENKPAAIEQIIKKLGKRYGRLHVCFEAGPTGYGLCRQVRDLGHDCMVVAPTLIPKRSGERVKTNRAGCSYAGTAAPGGRVDRGVGTGRGSRGRPRPGPGSRGGSRRPAPQAPAIAILLAAARTDLRWGRLLDAGSSSLARPSGLRACGPADRLPGEDRCHCGSRRQGRLDEQLAVTVPTWSMAPVVEAYQAMRGASFLVAVIFAAEIGDVRRFDAPPQLMAFLGLVPGERSTGETVRRSGLTLAGNRRARRALVEAAWTYRYPARVSEALRARLEGLPKAVREIAWKAQVRLCARYRRLSAAGKKLPVVVAAIAREMAAFLWAIGREVAPA